jgi:hypothetical protein
LDQLA